MELKNEREKGYYEKLKDGKNGNGKKIGTKYTRTQKAAAECFTAAAVVRIQILENPFL